MPKLSKIKVDKKDYEAFAKWKSVQGGFGKGKKSHKFRNYLLLIIVILVVWFVFGKESFLAFFNWLFGLF